MTDLYRRTVMVHLGVPADTHEQALARLNEAEDILGRFVAALTEEDGIIESFMTVDSEQNEATLIEGGLAVCDECEEVAYTNAGCLVCGYEREG